MSRRSLVRLSFAGSCFVLVAGWSDTPLRAQGEGRVSGPIARAPSGDRGSGGGGRGGCVPVPDRGPRGESEQFRDPPPDPSLMRAVARMQRLDPHASFTFTDCEVDGFATRPRPTVPAYARKALKAAGLPTEPRPVELLPGPTTADKATQDLDGAALLRHKVPLPEEPPVSTPPGPDEGGDDAEGDPNPGRPALEQRTEPPIQLEPRESPFAPPSRADLRREAGVALPVLHGFLARHDDVFRMGRSQLVSGLPGLRLIGFRVGRFFRAATFTQRVGHEPVLEGRTQALYDANWNVIGISRTLYTPRKLAVPWGRVIPRSRAIAIAGRTVADLTGKDVEEFEPGEVLVGLDALRRERAWQVQLVDPDRPEFDFTVRLHATTGDVLNVSDNVDAFTDAKTRRWAYTSGDQTQPYQVISTGIYTRDDNTMRHDFFYLETDERGGGIIGQVPCNEPFSGNSVWRALAWGTNSSPWSFIRHTHRSDRDFSLWSPAHGDGTFGESHAYYWSRWYFQWMKPALNELGVLPASAADYPKTTIIANACIDDIGIASSSLDVTIQHNEGEGEGKVRLGDLCRQGNPGCSSSQYADSNRNSFLTCEGGGCHPTPSVIHHEINHRVLKGMFGVGSGLDCGSSEQLKFIHEGLLGSVLPQAFWHFWYGVGFNPADKDRLFTADAVRGRVHESVGTNLELTDYLCTASTEGQGPYEAGRVAGQPLWEIYHGRRVVGDQILNTWRPATDTDFLVLSYWAADLVASSTYKDRYEFANRVMQILDVYSSWPSAGKGHYCEIFEHHELDNFIEPSYCS